MSDGPYTRVYHSIVDDERFVSVYPDDAALAAWVRLLMAADATYPASAPLPRHVRPKALATLVGAGIVELVGQSHYRIHGLASEREKRSQSARNAAAKRWQSEPHASRAEPSKAEPSLVTPLPLTEGRRSDGTNPRALGTNPRANGHSPRQERAAMKRGGAESLAAILAKSNEIGRQS